MKKPLLKLVASAFLIPATMCVAQPTLTATGSNPVLGNSFLFNTTSYFAPGTAGANQTWNFSTLSSSGNSTSTVVTPSSTPNGSSFPAATIAFNNGSLNNYSYQKTSATAFQNYGSVNSGGVVMAYSNPEDLMHYPFTYNNTYTDAWATTYVSGGYTFYRTGTTTITADGYGTLMIPSGTYTNVVRVHMVQVYKDSANFGSFPSVTNYNNDEYLWFKDGIHTSLAACLSTTTSGFTTQLGVFYGSVVGIDEISGVLEDFNIYPNPAVDEVSIDFNLLESSAYSLNVYNSLGQSMITSENKEGAIGTKNIRMNVSAFPEGIYFAEIMMDNNRRVSKRFVVSK